MPQDSKDLIKKAKEDITSGDYDSAEEKLNIILKQETEEKEIYTNAYIRLGEIKWQRGKYKEALHYFETAEELGKKYEHAKQHAKALRFIGNVNFDQGQIDIGKAYYEKSLNLFKKIKNKKGIARCYNNLGIVFGHKGDFNNAMKYYLDSLNVHEELEDQVGIGMCLNNIGEIYRFRGEFEKAEEYYWKSLESDTELGDKYGAAICWGNLGDVSLSKGNYNEAEERIWKSIKIFEELETFDLTYLEIRGLMVNVMSQTKRFELAQFHLDAINEASRALESSYGETIVELYSGILAQQQGNISDAKKYLENCRRIAEKSNNFEYILLSLVQLIELDLFNYRITQEDDYLDLMTKNLDKALEMAQNNSLYSATVELLVLKGLLFVEDFEMDQGAQELGKALQICEEKGFKNQKKRIEKHLKRIHRRKTPTAEGKPETLEEMMERLQQYVTDCQRLIMGSK